MNNKKSAKPTRRNSFGGGVTVKPSSINSLSGIVNKKRLLAALVICAAISVPANAYNDTIEYINKEVKDRTSTVINSSLDNIIIKNSTFSKNNVNALFANGGVINSSSSVIDITNSHFTENSAEGIQFQGDWYGGDGGAIYFYAGNITINGSEFTKNSAKSGSGGAIIGTTSSTAYPLNISKTTFENNTAAKDGGAISIDNLNGSGLTFNNNTADNNGGALYSDSELKLADSKFNGNKATNGNGGAIYKYFSNSFKTEISNTKFNSNEAGKDGGAIYTDVSNLGLTYEEKAVMNITGSEFKENKASNGGAISSNAPSNNMDKSSLVVKSSKFEGNSASSSGGAIKSAVGNTLLDNSTFTSNSAANGGAVYNDKGILNITNGSTFTGNSATSDSGEADGGGAIYNKGTINNITGASFSQNTANGSGGAIYSALQEINDEYVDSKISITDTKFDANSSANPGGAIYAENTLEINNSKFTNNSATDDYGGQGGALAHVSDNNHKTKATISGTTFENNTAKAEGGAIWNASGDLTVKENSIFNNNTAESDGGAIAVSNADITADKSTFTGNKSNNGSGGAIYVFNASTATVTNSAFTLNSAAINGGAIYNAEDASAMTINDGTTFTSNSAAHGGAIAHDSTGTLDITGATFDKNNATVDGGALYNINGSEVNIKSSHFTNNNAQWGGAIDHGSTGTLSVKDSTFENNNAGVQGGAILSERNTNKDATVLNIDNGTFKNNSAKAEGGAVWSGSQTSITNSNFDSNKTTGTTYHEEAPNYNTDDEGGGAVFVGSNSATTIEKSKFTNNESGTVGGAIATRSNGTNATSSLTVTSSDFDGNKAAANGGGVATYIDANLTDSNFTNNSANGKGGAIWANGNLTVNAQNSNVTMSGNKASEGGDIYMNKQGANLNLNAAEGKSIKIADGISGNSDGYNMNVNTDSLNTGSIELNSEIQNARIAVQNGTFHLAEGSALNNSTLNMAGGTTLNTINNSVDNFGNNITLQDNVNLAVDVNLGNNKADDFARSNVLGGVKVTQINPIGSPANSNGTTVNLADALGVNPNNLSVSNNIELPTIMTPVRKLAGRIEDSNLIYAPTGNGYRDFNSSVFAAPVAAQLGGYLSQLNSYDEAFRNLDMKMLLNRQERQALKMANRYADVETPHVFSPTYLPEKDSAGWFRPYSSFENVHLKNGPRVSNVMYGSYFGGDSQMYETKNGWDYQYSIYIGYNGSHQAYDGNSIYQNGGNLGATGVWYKGDFFTALTANVGASVAEASTMYGNEDFPMLMTGVASKSGYNWELANGKFIIQPSYMMSYTFVNTFDYTNNAGVRINSDPLHAINITPGLKFIGNLKNGWQPYIGVSMVWNIMDKTEFTAANSSLPDLSVKPYIQYGVGVQKRWGERFTGFFQTMFRNGGRNGVALSLGFRWALGKDPSERTNIKSSELSTNSIKTSHVIKNMQTTKISSKSKNNKKLGLFGRIKKFMNLAINDGYEYQAPHAQGERVVLKQLSVTQRNHINKNIVMASK